MTQYSAIPSDTAPSDPDAAPARSREDEILDRIRSIFAEKGFDGASMQELARAAGMSVGNFYRYFPSKSAIVEALIVIVTLAVREYLSDKRLKKDGFLDG